jgi:hypothetical protein
VAQEAFDVKSLEMERDALAQAIKEEEQELGRQSFWYFLTKILFPEVWQEHYSDTFHRDLCYDIQNLDCGEDLWAIVPRAHRKSFIITIAHTLWMIVRDPNIRILLIGAREETVKPFARMVINAFVAGTPGFEKFQQVYDDFVIHKKGRNVLQSFQFTHPNRTISLPDPTFRAAYLGVTGAGWRCDILKFDDAIERRNVTSPEMSVKTMTQMLDLTPLIDVGSKYRNLMGVGTRWAYHDPYGRFIGEDFEQTGAFNDVIERIREKGTTKVIVRHALEDPHRMCEVCPKHVVEMCPHGHPSMEEDAEPIAFPIHTRETIMKEYERYLADPNLGESLFYHQWMNVCLAPSDQKIKAEWFQQVKDRCFVAPRRKVITLDDASKDYATEGIGDYSVALFGEFDDEGRLMILDGLRSNRWTKDKFIREIISWCQRANWWPNIVAKEKVSTEAFLPDLQRAFQEYSRPAHFISVPRPTNIKKYDWLVAALQGPFERCEVVFGANCKPEIFQRARHEGTTLTQATHDDVVDAMAIFFSQGVRHNAAPRIGTRSGLENWNPPDMRTYNPDAPAPYRMTQMTPKNPWEQAGQSERVQQAISEVAPEGQDPFNVPAPEDEWDRPRTVFLPDIEGNAF